MPGSSRVAVRLSDAKTVSIGGHILHVLPTGYFWRPTPTERLTKIGETRVEAIAFLKQAGAAVRLSSPRKPKVARSFNPRKQIRVSTPTSVLWRPYHWATSRAKKTGLTMMSRDEYLAMWERSGGCCEVSGLPFRQTRQKGTSRRPWAHSIDRIEPSRGYDADNCRLVCSAVNLAMNEYGADTLLIIARALVEKYDKTKL